MALPVRIWILISAAATLAGWTLSAFGQLNRPGYAIFFAIAALLFFLCRQIKNRKSSRPDSPQQTSNKIPANQTIGCWTPGAGRPAFFRKFSRRLRRPLPFCFAVFAILIFIGGVIHAPDNYTGLTYRVARVLQWLAHNSWHWIHTSIYRMNDRACGIEWLSAPLLLFTNSTRGLFLLNFIPFLLWPGLIFSVFTRLGVHRRVAWQWMWLLPTGYIFLLQAGSIANDTFPTIYALAAIDFALRARKSNRFSDFAFSILAAALMTGAKASNLPLLLPWIFVMATVIKDGKWKMNISGVYAFFRFRSLVIVCLAAVVSFLPTAILNLIYCHDWSGAVLEPANMTVKNPLTAIAGNLFQFFLQNFCLPLFPFAGWWNHHAQQLMPQPLILISNHFDTGFFQLGELPTEDSAGIGFGLSVLLVAIIFAKWFNREFLSRFTYSGPRLNETTSVAFRNFILFTPWLALLAYSAKSGMTTASRLIAPYYPLLLPLLLAGNAPARIIRRRWWKILVVLHLFFALVVLVLSPDRPLFPAQTVLSKLVAQHPGSHLLARAFEVYSVYAHRADPLADVRPLLPKDAKVVGFIGNADDCDISLWLPLGSRTVKHFLLSDSPGMIRGQDIQYVVVGGYNLSQNGMTIDQWLQKSDAELIGSATATLKVSEGPQKWFVARMK